MIDLDIRAFFDSIPWGNLMLKAVSKHTDLRWVLLYIERWLKAPLQMEDGTLVATKSGTPGLGDLAPFWPTSSSTMRSTPGWTREFPFVRKTSSAMRITAVIH